MLARSLGRPSVGEETRVMPLSPTEALPAGDYLLRLRRRWWVLALGLGLGILAAAAFTSSRTPRFTSAASVLVLPTGASASSSSTTGTRSEVNMDTESELIRSAEVATAAQSLLKSSDSPADLLVNLGVTVPTNSQVLAITYVGPTAKAAQQGAQAFVKAYLDYRGGQAQKDIEDANSALRAELADAQQQLRLATDKSAALPANAPDKIYADAQRGILGNQIASLTNRLSTLAASAAKPGEVITAPALPQAPSYPTPALNLAAGVVVGLLGGLAMVMAVDNLDRRLRHASDVTRHLRLPVLAQVPRRRVARDVTDPRVAADFDQLRNVLVGRDPGLRVVQVSDPGGDGASSSVALHLAQALARTKGEATLVIAHPRSSLPDLISLFERDGLVQVLQGTKTVTEVRCRLPQAPGVWVLPPGRDLQGLEAVLQSPAMRVLLKDLSASTPAVVLESLGTGQSGAAQALSTAADSVLLVAERGVANRRTIAEAAQGAQQMGADLAGVVLVPRQRRRPPRVDRPGPEDDGAVSDGSAAAAFEENGSYRSGAHHDDSRSATTLRSTPMVNPSPTGQ